MRLRYRTLLENLLEPGESLVAASGAIVSRRRRRTNGLPRKGFVLVVTDRRLLACEGSTWRVVPGGIITSWSFEDGAALAPSAFGRALLVLPDRSTVTLAPYGGWSLRALTR